MLYSTNKLFLKLHNLHIMLLLFLSSFYNDFVMTQCLQSRRTRGILKIETPDHRQPKLGIRFIEFVWKINFELINVKISCKCRNKLRLPLRTVVLVFSVQSEGKLCPF